MAKPSKATYVCQSCGYQTPKWLGRCPGCMEWNTLVEEFAETGPRQGPSFSMGEAQTIASISLDPQLRLKTGIAEFDRTLGGGLVPGSLILIGGDPGIGKSTILLQLALNISGKRLVAGETDLSAKTFQNGSSKNAKTARTVFYITGEESLGQLKTRIERIILYKELADRELFVISDTDIDRIIALLSTKKPDFIIVDSIQTMQTSDAPGFPEASLPQNLMRAQ